MRPGAFVAGVGADSPDKSELDPGLLAGTLADVAANPERYRAPDAGVTVFDGTGIPLEDVVAASLAFERAERDGIGTAVTLR